MKSSAFLLRSTCRSRSVPGLSQNISTNNFCAGAATTVARAGVHDFAPVASVTSSCTS